MAAEEVTQLDFAAGAAKKRVEFWASTMDAFLQDFLEKASADDRLGTIVASARLAQLGAALSEEYEITVNELTDSPTEAKVAQQACEHVVKLCNGNSDACIALRDGTEGPATEPAPDRSLS